MPGNYVLPVSSGCIVDNPTTQSIKLGNRYINACAVADTVGHDRIYISKILSGNREPSLQLARKIAAAIGFSLGELLDAIAARKENKIKVNVELLKQHQERVRLEEEADECLRDNGKTPVPRLPGLRTIE